MWSRQLFIVWFFALTILATQSHVIHKRGLISKLFGGSSKSKGNVEKDLPPRERSKFRELLKNPIVITMLSAAVGMVVQQALAAKNMNDVCDNKYVKMAYQVGSFSPELFQVLNLLGCNGPNRKYGSSTIPTDKYATVPGKGLPTPSPSMPNDEDQEEQEEEEETDNQDDGDTLESGLPPEKESKIKQLLKITRGEKGAKRNFLKSLFGGNKNVKPFKSGQKLPSSSYKLDKDDANSLKQLEKELEEYNKAIH
ncbi:unnamed protein product [Adineta steineri]|uniref:Uncharacterized protein n=1 Tax=Adineta steineri TaxID=433720 RepID=A0A814YE18_9BILA|nr:unnamed protein product [Adineta steineri]CAF1409147.1 unnamed protein product [Adineta steineri]